MKFETIRFHGPTSVFGNSTGMLSTLANETDRKVDSIEPLGFWLIVRRDGKTRAVPASAIASADVIEESLEKKKV